MKKSPANLLLTLTMIMLLLNGVTGTTTVSGSKPTFTITIDKINGQPADSATQFLNPIHLEGSVSATNFVGQLAQYQVQIEWGDGTVDTDSNINLAASPDGKDFTGTWSSNPDHTYASHGTWTITVKLYHQVPPGAESGLAQAQLTITVIAEVTVTTSPEGLSVTVDGNTYTSPAEFNWCAGETHNIGTTSTQNGGEGTQYIWQYWSDGGAITHEITVTPNPATYTAYFKTQYYLEVNDNIGGQTGLTAYSGWKDEGATVALTAPNVPGYVFDEWKVDGAPQGQGVNSITVSMNMPHTATACYRPEGTSSMALVTFSQTGINADFAGVVLTVDGTGYSAAELPKTFTWEIGSEHTFAFNSPLVVGANAKKYLWTSTSGLSTAQTGAVTVTSGGGAVTGNYKTQYYLTVTSPYGAATGEGWYDAGSTAYAGLSGNIIDHGNLTRRIFGNWGGDASGTNYAQSSPITMNAPKTAVANWKTQYWLEISSSHGSTTPASGWYDAYSEISISATAPSTVTGERFEWQGWTGTGEGSYTGINNPASVTMNGPITETASWKHQYCLTVQSAHGVTSGSGWYDEGTTAYAGLDTGIVTDAETRFLFIEWSGDAAGTNYAQSNPIIMNAPKTATAVWTNQYRLTVRTSGLGTQTANVYNGTELLGTAADTNPYTGWFDAGSLILLKIEGLITGGSTRFIFLQWSGDAAGTDNPTNIIMDNAKDITAHYNKQYYLTVNTGPAEVETLNPSAVSGEGWYDSGTTATVNALQNVEVSEESRYDFRSWAEAASTGEGNQAAVLMDGPKTVTANYQLQHLLTLAASPPDIGVTLTGAGWYDAGTAASISAGGYVTIIPGESRYCFSGWTTADMSEIADPAATSTTVLMDKAKTVTANYVVQYAVNFTQTGSQVAPAVEYTVDNGPITTSTAPFTVWVDEGSEITYTYQEAVNGGQGIRYYFTGACPVSPQTINAALEVTGTYKTQYYLSMLTNYGTVSPESGWYDAESTVTISATADELSEGERFSWLGWTGTGSGSYTGTENPASITMNAPITQEAQWKHEYQLTVTSLYGNPNPQVGQHWYEAGSIIIASVEPVITADGTRYICTGWTGTGSVSPSGTSSQVTFIINKPSSLTWEWKIQHYLTVNVNPEGAGAVSPYSGWYDAGSKLQISASPYAGYRFEGWSGSGLGSYSGPQTQAEITLNSPMTETANFVAVATVTFLANGLASDAHGAVLTVDGTSYTYGQLPVSFIWDVGSTHEFAWTSQLDTDTNGKLYTWTSTMGPSTLRSGTLTVTGSAMLTGNYVTMYYLEVFSPYGNPYGSGWYQANSAATFGVTTPVDHGNKTLRVLIKWTGDTEQFAPEGLIIMTKPSSVTANWETQYLVTFNTTLPNGVVLSIPNVPKTLPPNMEVFGMYYPAYETITVGPAPATVQGEQGTRYTFNGWTIDGATYTKDTGLSFIVDKPHDVSITYGTEHLLLIKAIGVRSQFTATVTVTASQPKTYDLTPKNSINLWLAQGTHVQLAISTPNKIGHGEWAIFKEWTGTVQETEKTTTFTLQAPAAVNAVFFKVNPVAESIPYSITAGLVSLALCTLYIKRKSSDKKEEHRNLRSATSGIIVSATALVIAAIVSAAIAVGYNINIYELLDFTNWAVVFLAFEALAFMFASTTITRKLQIKNAVQQ